MESRDIQVLAKGLFGDNVRVVENFANAEIIIKLDLSNGIQHSAMMHFLNYVEERRALGVRIKLEKFSWVDALINWADN